MILSIEDTYICEWFRVLACVLSRIHVHLYLCTWLGINTYIWVYFSCFSFSSASVYFHLFHPHNHHLSPNSPRLMFLFVKCATVNKVYLILSYLRSLIPLDLNIMLGPDIINMRAIVDNYEHYMNCCHYTASMISMENLCNDTRIAECNIND